MATKDPAYLFYPADASEDTQFMNRLERGCYFDLMKAHKKFPRYSIEMIKKVLGQDFESCWASIVTILKQDEGGYFIEWVDNSIERRKQFSKAQTERITKYHDNRRKEQQNATVEQPTNYHGTSDEVPYVNENEIGNVIVNEKGNENKSGQPQNFDSFVEDWNLYAEKNNKPKIKTLNAERKRKLKTRTSESAFDFREILKTAHSSHFIRDGTWFSFDWVIDSEKNYLKVLEGNYNQNGTGTTKNNNNGYSDLKQQLAKRLSSSQG